MTKAFLVLDDNKFAPLEDRSAHIVYVSQENSQGIRSVQDLHDRALLTLPLDAFAGGASSSEGNIPRGPMQGQNITRRTYQSA